MGTIGEIRSGMNNHKESIAADNAERERFETMMARIALATTREDFALVKYDSGKLYTIGSASLAKLDAAIADRFQAVLRLDVEKLEKENSS